jgi:3-oxoacyl-[acyl-carrier protein] reductase
MPISRTPVAIVTGASRGIGACIAQTLGRAGYAVVMMSRGGSRDTARRLGDHDRQALDLKGDVRNPEDCKAVVAAALDQLKSIDLLVNNAGLMVGDRDIVDTTSDCWTAILETNLSGAFFMVAATLPSMIEQRKGLIVNITSGAAVRSGFLNLPYGVSKAGLDRMTLGIGAELGTLGIHCVSLSPPVSATETVRSMYPGRDVDSWAQAPELTAQALLSLVREGAGRYTGTVVSVREYLNARAKR